VLSVTREGERANFSARCFRCLLHLICQLSPLLYQSNDASSTYSWARDYDEYSWALALSVPDQCAEEEEAEEEEAAAVLSVLHDANYRGALVS